MLKKMVMWIFLVFLATSAAEEKNSRAVWITLSGDVDQGMADYTKRAIAQAVAQSPDAIVFEINTFGGLLHAAFEIVDTITGIKGIPTVAYVTQKAISAGALIALACNRLYMKPSTTIGDCAPIIQSQEGPQILGEKIQSPLRAKFRNLAQRNGYPELLAESMVTPELEVVKVQKGDSLRYMDAKDYEELSDAERKEWGSKKTLVREGELLTMTEVEALQMGFSSGTPETEQALLALLQVQERVRVEISWAEKLASFIAGISPILMILAFGLLYMEFQTPGFGVFGIAGLTLLAILVGGQYVSGLADQLPLVLLVIGVALFVVEIVFFPGTWIAGIVGIAFLIASVVLALRDFSPSLPGGFDLAPSMDGLQRALLLVIGSALAALVIPVLASRFVLPRFPAAISPMLQSGLADAVSPRETVLPVNVGETGVVVSMLKPTGKARFGDQVIEVHSVQNFLDSGAKVRVIGTEGGRIVVTEIKEVS